MVVRNDASLDLRPGVVVDNSGAGNSYRDGASLSGHERNHLFLNDGTGRFMDVSGASGLNAPADGRAVAALDFDRDGRIDFAVANANEPAFQLFRNELGGDSAPEPQSVTIRLVGGNQSSDPSVEWSNRDGVGARLRIVVGDRTIFRTTRAGEGFAAQSSGKIHVGLGADAADRITVQWPSGREQTVENVPAGHLVTFFENPTNAPDPLGVRTQPLRSSPIRSSDESPLTHGRIAGSEAFGPATAALRLWTTMATWCEACRAELPDIARLREAISEDDLEIVGLPIDPEDTREKLDAYVEAYRPAYRMTTNRTAQDVAQIQQTIQTALRRDVLPASVLTNQAGEVQDVFWGVPTVSDIRRILSEPDRSPHTRRTGS